VSSIKKHALQYSRVIVLHSSHTMAYRYRQASARVAHDIWSGVCTSSKLRRKTRRPPYRRSTESNCQDGVSSKYGPEGCILHSGPCVRSRGYESGRESRCKECPFLHRSLKGSGLWRYFQAAACRLRQPSQAHFLIRCHCNEISRENE
jgi:hypothetical protein